ncbi:MAG TPA: hypothetical protein VGS11_10510 [Candidatus Bathyarchaeia archaeon]|nr:hypothetical protein [Candidatus Bathyarchaeia archaeon]
MQITVERNIGSYKVQVTGRREEFGEILEVLNDVADEIAKTNQPSAQVTQATYSQAEIPSISRSTRLSEAISDLFKSDWGANQRGISEVKDALATNGLIYPLTTLSGTLLSLTKRGLLRRIKTPDGYRYVRGTNL